MANIFNADDGAISGSAGIKLSSDTSGVLNIQTNGVTAISIAANQVVSFPATVGINFNGQIQFEAGTALIPAISTVADTNTGIYFPGADQIAISTGGVQRFFVGATGDVGIGTGSPSSKLTIKNPSITGEQNILNIQNASSGSTQSIGRLSFNQTDDVMRLYNEILGSLAFGTDNAERVRIDSSGNVGIGTSSPGTKLHVANGDLRVSQSGTGNIGFNLLRSGGTAVDWFNYIPSGSSDLRWFNNGNDLLTLTTSGNLGLRVTPNAWQINSYRAIQIGQAGAFWAQVDTLDASISTNGYIDSAYAWRYMHTGAATWFRSETGTYKWFIAPSGTAGNAITFTQAMTLDASGNLGIGTTSPAAKLHVAGDIYISATSSPKLIFQYSRIGEDLFDTDSLGLASDSTEPITFGTYNSGTATYSERARLTAAGELCIQRTTPTFNSANRGNITIGGTDSSILFLGTGNGSGSYIFHEQSTAGMEVWNTANGYIRFATNANERARITNGGALFVGTTSYESTGGASSGATAAGFGYFKSSRNTLYATCTDGTNSYEPLGLIRSASTGNLVAFWYGYATQVGTITTNGTNTAYNTSSDRRLKANIFPADDAGLIIDAIEVVKHDWKTGGHTRYGMIAQDLHAIAPEAVSVGDPDSVEELKQPWGVDYSKLVPMLVKEIQSLRQRVAQLEVK